MGREGVKREKSEGWCVSRNFSYYRINFNSSASLSWGCLIASWWWCSFGISSKLYTRDIYAIIENHRILANPLHASIFPRWRKVKIPITHLCISTLLMPISINYPLVMRRISPGRAACPTSAANSNVIAAVPSATRK